MNIKQASDIKQLNNVPNSEALNENLQYIQYLVEKAANMSPFSISGGSQKVRKTYITNDLIDKPM